MPSDPAIPGPGTYPTRNPRDHRLGFFGRSGRDPTSLVPEDLRTPTLRRDNLRKPAPCEHDVRGLIPGSKLKVPVRFPRAERFTRGHADDNPGPGSYHKADERPEERAQKGGVSFTHARRRDTSMGDRDIPGPGTYKPTLPPKRLRSATFGRASRAPPEPARTPVNADAEQRASERRQRLASRSQSMERGLQSTSGGIAAGVSFTKASRDSLRLAATASPGPGRYSPGFGTVDKRPRSAVLYLGA
jgi:hypothetical protein